MNTFFNIYFVYINFIYYILLMLDVKTNDRVEFSG